MDELVNIAFQCSWLVSFHLHHLRWKSGAMKLKRPSDESDTPDSRGPPHPKIIKKEVCGHVVTPRVHLFN
jgi:hypothetical protein